LQHLAISPRSNGKITSPKSVTSRTVCFVLTPDQNKPGDFLMKTTLHTAASLIPRVLVDRHHQTALIPPFKL
jgi:hypothetical protein